MKMTTPIPENITTPDKIESPIGTLEFFDGVPNRKTIDAVYDYVDRARAVAGVYQYDTGRFFIQSP